MPVARPPMGCSSRTALQVSSRGPGFLAPGRVAPLFTRFSTVIGSRGSADTVRDVRGFAVAQHGSGTATVPNARPATPRARCTMPKHECKRPAAQPRDAFRLSTAGSARALAQLHGCCSVPRGGERASRDVASGAGAYAEATVVGSWSPRAADELIECVWPTPLAVVLRSSLANCRVAVTAVSCWFAARPCRPELAGAAPPRTFVVRTVAAAYDPFLAASSPRRRRRSFDGVRARVHVAGGGG